MVKWRVGGSSGLLRKVQRVSVCCSMALEFREMWYIHWSYGDGGEWTDSFPCAHFWCAWETSQACVYCDAISEEKWTGAGQGSYLTIAPIAGFVIALLRRKPHSSVSI